MKGLLEGYDPHMLDVAQLVKASWDAVSEMTIARYWFKSAMLPAKMDAGITATYGRMHNHEKDRSVKQMIQALKRLALNIFISDLI